MTNSPKKYWIYIFLSVLYFLYGTDFFAQVESGGQPASFSAGFKSELEWVSLGAVDNSSLLKEDSVMAFQGFKSLRFGIGMDGLWSTANSGSWSTDENGLKIWRIGFNSSSAHSMGVILSDIHLLPGEKIFIYSPGPAEIRGGYEFGIGNVLSVIPLRGDKIVVELDCPAGVETTGHFTIERVIHGYRDIDQLLSNNLPYTQISGSCNIDINCPDGADWQDTKRGVAKIIINGNEICSGSLINSTLFNSRPFFLTANHCISTPYLASRSLFIFNYEHSVCGGTGGSISQNITGAKLLATTTNLDFSLNELGIAPPYAFNPLYLGWSHDSLHISRTVCIHHPSGDVKKISIDNDPPVVGNFGSGYDVNSHWQILRWDKGTTEGGSSGAPLLDQNHCIVGTLTGGDANCSSSINDFFQKFNRSWDDYSDSTRQLKYWLDPYNAGVDAITAHEPWHFLVENKYSLQNTLAGDSSLTLKSTTGWGYLAGHNSTGAISYAEPFYLPDSVLILGIMLKPGKIYSSANDSYITLNLWKGNGKPDSLLMGQKVLLSSLKPNTYTEVPFWKNLILKDSIYAGFTVSYLRPDTFAVCTTPSRSLPEMNTAQVFLNNQWESLYDAYNYSGSMNIVLELAKVSWLSEAEENKINLLRIFPNPSRDGLNFQLPPSYKGGGLVSIFSLSGKLLRKIHLEFGVMEGHVDLSGMDNGYYLLRYDELAKTPLQGKFIILNDR